MSSVNSRGEHSRVSPYTHVEYGFCDVCETPLVVSEWFDAPEYDRHGIPTGYYHRAASSLVCPMCLKYFCIDDSLDEQYSHR